MMKMNDDDVLIMMMHVGLVMSCDGLWVMGYG